MNRKYIYIAGPYTKGDTVQNVRDAIIVANVISLAGHFPFIPHLTMFWHFIYPHNYQFWLDQDIGWLLKCDYLIRLYGESSGADGEVEIAKKNGIPVFFSVDGCLDWINRNKN
jgi:hypothetical protein